MPDAPQRRWLRFSVRHLLVAFVVVALLSAWLTAAYRRMQLRQEILDHAGAVRGRARTIQGVTFRERPTLWGLFFRGTNVRDIWLYQDAYVDQEYREEVQSLFPEATISAEMPNHWQHD